MRRFTAADIGPVPITPAMDPKLQEIFRAGNDGVNTTQADKRKQKNWSSKRHVRPSSVILSARDYITAMKMDQPYTWGGSTELEAAADWLQTPIKVFHSGNPKLPPKSWITHGCLPEFYNSHVILLQWTNQDHYDYVSELV